MKVELDLLENSYDYLNNALYFYNQANLDDGHAEGQADIAVKKKWKLAFVLLTQSFELLLKEILRKTNNALIYEKIDDIINDKSATISYRKAIIRINNIKNNVISDEDKEFIINCGDIRNNFIHYKVEFNSIEIKKKFCKLAQLYSKYNKKYIKQKINIDKINFSYLGDAIEKADNLYILRGCEFNKEEYNDFLKEIEDNKKYSHYKDNDGIHYRKNLYGIDDNIEFVDTHKYCPNCLAEKGENHLNNCDLEMCPKCHNQLISCDCNLELFNYDAYITNLMLLM